MGLTEEEFAFETSTGHAPSWAAVAAYLTAVISLDALFGNPLTEQILFTDAAGQSSKVLAV